MKSVVLMEIKLLSIKQRVQTSTTLALIIPNFLLIVAAITYNIT